MKTMPRKELKMGLFLVRFLPSFNEKSDERIKEEENENEWKSQLATYFNLIIFQFQFLQAPQLRKDRIADESQFVEAQIQHLQISQALEDFARQFADTVIAQ